MKNKLTKIKSMHKQLIQRSILLPTLGTFLFAIQSSCNQIGQNFAPQAGLMQVLDQDTYPNLIASTNSGQKHTVKVLNTQKLPNGWVLLEMVAGKNPHPYYFIAFMGYQGTIPTHCMVSEQTMRFLDDKGNIIQLGQKDNFINNIVFNIKHTRLLGHLLGGAQTAQGNVSNKLPAIQKGKLHKDRTNDAWTVKCVLKQDHATFVQCVGEIGFSDILRNLQGKESLMQQHSNANMVVALVEADTTEPMVKALQEVTQKITAQQESANASQKPVAYGCQIGTKGYMTWFEEAVFKLQTVSCESNAKSSNAGLVCTYATTATAGLGQTATATAGLGQTDRHLQDFLQRNNISQNQAVKIISSHLNGPAQTNQVSPPPPPLPENNRTNGGPPPPPPLPPTPLPQPTTTTLEGKGIKKKLPSHSYEDNNYDKIQNSLLVELRKQLQQRRLSTTP